MTNSFNYFDFEHAIATHHYIIQQSGGLAGVKNEGTLKSILEHVQNDDYYPELMDKMTYLVYSINKNHAFNDGNKRASIALSSYFLELNGYDFLIKQYTYGMEEVAVWLASSLITQDTLKKIIEFLLFEEDNHILYFINEARKYRPILEQENNPLSRSLLEKMITCWLSDEMELSDEVNGEVLTAIIDNSI
jgi:death-on-curing protein